MNGLQVIRLQDSPHLQSMPGYAKVWGGVSLSWIQQETSIDQSNIDWTGIADTGPCVNCIEQEYHNKFIPLWKRLEE